MFGGSCSGSTAGRKVGTVVIASRIRSDWKIRILRRALPATQILLVSSYSNQLGLFHLLQLLGSQGSLGKP